jgi:hypothetical protein
MCGMVILYMNFRNGFKRRAYLSALFATSPLIAGCVNTTQKTLNIVVLNATNTSHTVRIILSNGDEITETQYDIQPASEDQFAQIRDDEAVPLKSYEVRIMIDDKERLNTEFHPSCSANNDVPDEFTILITDEEIKYSQNECS